MTIHFLQSADYLKFISENAFQKLIRGNDSRLSDSELTAFGHVYDQLSARYRIDLEIQKQGESRHLSLVRWMTILAVYYLYQTVPDDEIPKRVRQNFEDVIAEIGRVVSGADNTTLTPVADAPGQPINQDAYVL